MTIPETPQNPTPQAAPYQAAPQPAAAPGKGLSIAAIILAVLMPLIGLILGIIAMVQSKKAGQKNGLALASIIVAILLIIGGIIVSIILVSSGATALAAAEACMNGASSVEVMGQTVDCAQVLAE